MKRKQGMAKGKLIDLTGDTVTILCQEQLRQGTVIDYKIQLPEPILLDSFIVCGVITTSDYIQRSGESGFLTQITIGKLPSENQQILEAFVLYLNQERELGENQVDYEALEGTLRKFWEGFFRIVSGVERLSRKTLPERIRN